MTDILKVYKQIAGHAADMECARELAESKLEEIKPKLIGLRIQVPRGTYEICSARIGWDGLIEISGLKVTTSGKLGLNEWDIGQLYERHLTAASEDAQ